MTTTDTHPAHGWRVALVLGVLAAGTLAMAFGLSLLNGGENQTTTKRIDWSVSAASLRADAIEIQGGGRTFLPPADVELEGSAGSLETWDLDATWVQHGRAQRLLMEFASDSRDWWVSAIETYDGTVRREWARFDDLPVIRAPLETPWKGDIDIVSHGLRADVRLRIAALELSVSPQVNDAAPPDGGKPLDEEIDPFAPGGPLAGFGVYRMSPAEAHQRLLALGYRVSWRFPLDQRHYLCLKPPPGKINAEEGSVTGGSGEIILWVIPDSFAGVTLGPDDCR